MNGEPAPARLYQSAIDADRGGDLGRARTLLRQAAAAGHGAAALPLAGCLIDGRGGAVEAAEAMRALTPLENGAPIARRMLIAAVMLEEGWPAALARRIAHAQSGDREAGFEIGLLLLDRGSGAAGPWLRRAADAGSGHAVAALARAALSAGAVPQGLRERLQRVAGAGHPLAGMLAAAIAALPEAPADDAAPDAAEALETLAVPASLPARQALLETPRIAAMEALFSPALCDYLLAVAAPMLQRALMFDAAIGRSREHPHRRAFAASLPHSLMDLPMLAAQARMAAAADSDIHRAEALAILAYRPGDEYRPHLDCFTEDQGWASAEIAARGQRVATVLTVLNADFQGGATAFPRLGVRWKGAQGGALAFRNVDAAGAADPMTLHAGEPVTAGAKALASLWLRERPVGPDGVPVRQTG